MNEFLFGTILFAALIGCVSWAEFKVQRGIARLNAKLDRLLVAVENDLSRNA